MKVKAGGKSIRVMPHGSKFAPDFWSGAGLGWVIPKNWVTRSESMPENPI